VPPFDRMDMPRTVSEETRQIERAIAMSVGGDTAPDELLPLPRTISEETRQLEQVLAISAAESSGDVEDPATTADNNGSGAVTTNPIAAAAAGAVATDAPLDTALDQLRSSCPSEEEFASVLDYLSKRLRLLQRHGGEAGHSCMRIDQYDGQFAFRVGRFAGAGAVLQAIGFVHHPRGPDGSWGYFAVEAQPDPAHLEACLTAVSGHASPFVGRLPSSMRRGVAPLGSGLLRRGGGGGGGVGGTPLISAMRGAEGARVEGEQLLLSGTQTAGAGRGGGLSDVGGEGAAGLFRTNSLQSRLRRNRSREGGLLSGRVSDGGGGGDDEDEGSVLERAASRCVRARGARRAGPHCRSPATLRAP
jgi:hypothetical protein